MRATNHRLEEQLRELELHARELEDRLEAVSGTTEPQRRCSKRQPGPDAWRQELPRYWLRGLLQDRAIVIHQMGKVGSQSIERTLIDALPDWPIYKTHVLNPRRLRKRIQMSSNIELTVSQHLARRIEQGRTTGWRIITVVREPIGRNLSAFFQTIEHHISDFSERQASGEVTVDEIAHSFAETYPHSLPLTWLDEEIRDVFGIDVYSEPFRTEKGFHIYEGDGIKLLLLRLENLDRCAEEAFAAFLGRTDIQLKSANIAADKFYSDLYERVLAAARLPAWLLDEAYESRYARHFWTTGERSEYRARWSEASD